MNKIVIIVLILIVVIFVIFVMRGSLATDQPKPTNTPGWSKTINNIFGGLQESVVLDCEKKSPPDADRKCEQLPLEIKIKSAADPWLPLMKKTKFRIVKLVLIKGEATIFYCNKKTAKGIDNQKEFELPNSKNDDPNTEALVITEEGGTLTISCKNNTSCQVGQL